MSGGYLANAGQFLIDTLFSLYITAVMLRFLLQLVRANFLNPVSQFLVKVTNPPLKPLRRIIPGLAGIDMASVVLLMSLQMLKLVSIGLLLGLSWTAPSLAVISLGELINLVLNIFMIALLIQVVLSWVNPGASNPITAVLYSLNEPVLRPMRRIIPPISGFDLSPIFVFLSISLLKILLVAPILDMGRSLA